MESFVSNQGSDQFSFFSYSQLPLDVHLVQFVEVLGMHHRVIEYNQVCSASTARLFVFADLHASMCFQENLRIRSLEGGSSLIRSFPSKVSVRARTPRTRMCTRTRTGIRGGEVDVGEAEKL